MSVIVAGIGTTKESARASIDALGTTDPVTNLGGNPVSDALPAPGESLVWDGTAWAPGAGAGSGDYTVLFLAYDPSVPASGNGVFKTFNEFYTAYSTSVGPVHFYCAQSVQPDPGTYTFRKGTRMCGQFNVYDPPVQITLATGTVFEDVLWMDAIAIKSEGAPGGTLTWTDPYPAVRLENGAQILGNSPTPMVAWDTPSSAGFLNFDLQTRSEIRNLGPGPVFDLQGVGPGGDAAGIGIRLGQNCTVGPNTISSNVDALVNLDIKDGTASMSFNQPNYLGQGSPLDATQAPDLTFNTTLSVQNSFVINDLAGNGAPPWLQLVKTSQTTDAVPTLLFPIQAPPPVISVCLELRLVGKDTLTGDTAVWILKGLVRFGATAAFGPLGLVVDFHDADPGAATWDYDVILNAPAAGNIAFYVIGEAGRTINWSATIHESLVLAF